MDPKPCILWMDSPNLIFPTTPNKYKLAGTLLVTQRETEREKETKKDSTFDLLIFLKMFWIILHQDTNVNVQTIFFVMTHSFIMLIFLKF